MEMASRPPGSVQLSEQKNRPRVSGYGHSANFKSGSSASRGAVFGVDTRSVITVFRLSWVKAMPGVTVGSGLGLR